MWNWPITYLVVGFSTGLIAFFDVAGTADRIAWILCAVFAGLFLLSVFHRYHSA